MPKLGTKNALLGIFDQEPYFHFFGQELKKKLLSYLKSASSNFSICNISRKNKNAWIWVFLGWNLQTILSYLKSESSNLSNCNILPKKTKMPKFGIKSSLIWVFSELQAVSQYFEIFWCFTKFSFHHNWNNGRLLINMVFTSCLPSCGTTEHLGS